MVRVSPRPAPPAVFVAHARAVGTAQEAVLQRSRIWTSGVTSWYQLAQRGFWVVGCAEHLGFELLVPTLCEPVLQLPALSKWLCFTHADALDDWASYGVHAIPTYRLEVDQKTLPQHVRETGLPRATHLFWSSGSQFQLLKSWVLPGAIHSCGPGKTYQFLKLAGVEPIPFPSAKEWRKWINLSQ